MRKRNRKMSEKHKVILYASILFPSGIIGMISSSIKVFLPALNGDELKIWFIVSFVSIQLFLITIFSGLHFYLKEKASKGNQTDLMVHNAYKYVFIGMWLMVTPIFVYVLLKLFFPTPEILQGFKQFDHPLSLSFFFSALIGILMLLISTFYTIYVQNKERNKQGALSN